ncbi:hypothetical protein [Streptomyces griseus]|uniref:hypothetical protein n=1 Tax=Streptomyces griseus TaxID=1911 RepID=UPI00131E8553|nr:hypothetical protein [Streptomyces griseus]
MNTLTAQAPAGADELEHLVDQLTAAGWLTNTCFTGHLADRVLHLSCPLPASGPTRPGEPVTVSPELPRSPAG